MPIKNPALNAEEVVTPLEVSVQFASLFQLGLLAVLHHVEISSPRFLILSQSGWLVVPN